ILFLGLSSLVLPHYVIRPRFFFLSFLHFIRSGALERTERNETKQVTTKLEPILYLNSSFPRLAPFSPTISSVHKTNPPNNAHYHFICQIRRKLVIVGDSMYYFSFIR